jgi:hypothetical protein
MEHEQDRVSIEVAWPLRTQYGMIRVSYAHTFYPEEKGLDVRTEVMDFIANRIVDAIKREGERIELSLRPELLKNGNGTNPRY